MKQIFLKGVMLALLLMFLFKGGIRLLIVGWRLFLPMLAITIMYFVVRKIMQHKKLKKKPENDTIGSGQPITICPHCNKPKGSCPKCQD